MIVFRLSKSIYAHDLTGKGAEKSGGRWNSKGTALLYCSESRALCTAEIAVHTPLGNVPLDYELISVELPDHSLITLSSALPTDWKSIPPAHTTQLIGDRFVASMEVLTLKVPSVIVPGEYNFLINPAYPDFKKVKIIKKEKFEFDKRLFIK
ncbi:MAG: RES family NAD+ phosphorylase [Saprospiraceae bacterium]